MSPDISVCKIQQSASKDLNPLEDQEVDGMMRSLYTTKKMALNMVFEKMNSVKDDILIKVMFKQSVKTNKTKTATSNIHMQ